MSSTLAFPAFIALTLSALSPSASAASYYWDGADTGANANGGTGTWDTTSTNWDTALNSGANSVWGNTISDTANFVGNSGTVTLGGTVSLGGMAFSSGNYFIGSVAGNGTLDFGGATGSINSSTQGTGITNTINSNLTGSGGITIAANGDMTATGNSASGKLVLAGTNSGLTGGMTITAGLVSFNTAAAAGSGTITLNGGGIVDTIANTLTLTNAVSLNGTSTLRVYNGNTLALSGVVSGNGSATLFKTDSGTLTLSGANTFTGPVKIGAGIVSVTSLNSVNGGTPLLATSSLGAPTTVANGTIVFGSGTSAGTLAYTGSGETSDRVMEVASTSVGPIFNAGGTGLMKLTGAFSMTGIGSKTITLQGSTMGELAGVIGDSGPSGSTVTTAAFSSGATSVTLASVDGVGVGSAISGTGIGAGTTVTAVNTSTRVVTISPAATGAGTSGQTMTVAGVMNLTSVQKTGSGSNSIWALSGANTYTGQTKVSGGTLSATSLNSVNGGTPLFATSALGAPTTVANGTIALGASTTGGVLNYTGTGETTDRVLDMAGTTGVPGVNQSGTGLLKFTSTITSSGLGSKAFTLGGSTTGTGEISSAIADGVSGTTQMISAISSGSTTVTLASVDGVTVGSTISGTGFAVGTTVTAINTSTRVVTFSPAASGVGSNGQVVTVSGVVNLTGIAKNNSGTWTLSGANTYTGVTTINAGTLMFPKPANLYQGNSAAWNTTNLVVNSGGTLGLNVGGSGEFTTADVAYFDSLGSSTGGLKTGGFLGIDTTNAGGSLTYSGNFVNAGTATSTGLAKLGTGTLVLTGTNTYTGGTRIDGGTLVVTALPSSGTVTVNSAGTLALSGAVNYAPAMSGAGKITVATSTTSDTTTLAGSFSGFTGTMEISPATSGGKVQLNSSPASSATIKVLSGGTLFVSTATTYNGAVLLYGGTTGEALGQLRVQSGTWAGPVTLKATTTLGANNNFNGTISGAIGDEGNGFGFTKLGNAALTLTGANTYSGPTIIAEGSIKANTFNRVSGGTASSGLGAPTTVANGTIALGSTTLTGTLAYIGTGETTDRVINLAGTTGGGILDQGGTGLLKFTSDLTATGAGSKTLTLQGSGTGEIAGAIVNGAGTTALTKTGGGTWTLSGTNTYTGATSSNGGILVYANAGAVSGTGRNISTSGNGGVAFDFNTSLQTLLTTRITSGSTGGLSLTANNNLAENLDFAAAGYTGYLGAKDNVTYTGTLTPNGGNVRLGNQGGGVLTLNGSNIVTGTNNLSINGSVTFTSPQTYTGTTTFTTNTGTFNGGGTQIDVSKLSLSGGTLTNVDLTGSGTLTKPNSSTVTLASANSYIGGTSVTDGLFILSNSAAFGTGAVTLNTSGSTTARIQLTNGVNVANTLNLGVNVGISGRGYLEINNTSSAATWSGPINITASPTNGGHFYTDATSTLTLSGPITSSVIVSFRAGNFIIPSASTSSYSSIFISGNMQIGSNDSLVKTADVTLGNSAATTLDLSGFNQTVNTVVKSTNAATITNTAATAAVLTINNGSASTYGGTIVNGTGGVSLVKSGAGDLTLGGANTYTGSTTVSAGTLILGASTLADSSTVNIASGAKITVTTASDTVAHLFLNGVEVLPGTYGATGSGATHIDDSHFSGTGTLNVVTGPSGYSAWSAAKGLTTANVSVSANPDNDSLNNLGEFAFDGSPASASSDNRIVTKVATVGGVQVLTITLPVRTGAVFSGATEQVSAAVDGIVYRIQGGADLSTWTGVVAEVPAGDLAAVQSGIAAPETGWTNRSFYLTGGGTTGFLRAKVQE